MAARGKKSSGQAPASAGADRKGGRAPTASRAAEIETKLEIEPDAALPDLAGRPALAAAGLTKAADPATYRLDATYYDTAELDLLRSKVTLRRRTGGVDAGWHLKLPAVAGARTEVGLPLSAGEPGRVPAELGDLVRGTARGRPLRPVARLQNERVVRHLLDDGGGSMLEVADDRVTATPLLDGAHGPAAAPSQWRELEVELVDGTRDQLAATVDELIAAGARPAASSSKLARALAGAGVERQSAAAELPAESAGAVLIAALGRQRDRLITADRGVRDTGAGGGDGDAAGPVREAAVAVRRMRAILGVGAALFDRRTARRLRTWLGAVGELLTAADDLDAADRRLRAHLSDEPDEFAAPAAAQLAGAVARRRSVVTARLRAGLDAPDYLQLLRDLDAFVARPPGTARAARPARTELAELITAAWIRLRGRADTALADPGNASAADAVRRTATSLRYATEAAVTALAEDAVVLAAAIEEVQEALDEYHGAEAAAALLADIAQDETTGSVPGFTFGRLHAFEQAMAHGAVDLFTDAWDRVEDGDLVAALNR